MTVSIEIENCSIRSDENSWAWQLTANVASVSDWSALRSNGGEDVPIQISVRGQLFNFLVDGVERTRTGAKTRYSVKARSNTVRLASPYADQISKDWPATTAKTVAQELCDAVSIALDWQTVDWPIGDGKLSIKDQYPIDIIKKLAAMVGAVVQSSRDGGTLIVRPRYPVSPTKYAAVTPDHTISDDDDIITLSERYESRPGYDSIEISNQRSDDKPSISFSYDNATSLLNASVVPFQELAILDSADSRLELVYQGVFTEQVEDDVAITGGNGRLTRPYYGTLSSSWLYDDLGAVDIAENGELSTADAGQSILRISYTTKFHQYRVSYTDGTEKAQIYVEE